MENIFDEYIKRIYMAPDFDQRALRDRIRAHIKTIKGIKYFPDRLKCADRLATASVDELVAYDEYLNCMINMFFFQKKLQKSNRFSECSKRNNCCETASNVVSGNDPR